MKTFLLLLLATTVCAETHTLRYKATKGQTTRYSYAMSVSSTQTMNGAEQSFDIGTTMRIIAKADKVSKDSLTFIATAEKVKIDLPSEMKAMIEGKDDPAKALEGKRTRYTISPLGTQLSETNIDSMKGLGRMMRNIGSSVPFSLPRLPEHAVAVGGTWTEPGDTTKMRGMRVTKIPDVLCTFDKIVDTLGYTCARIFTSTKGPIAGAGELQQGINMTMSGEVTGSSVCYVALKEGILVAMKQSSENDATISVTGQMSMVIPAHQETTTTMVIVK